MWIADGGLEKISQSTQISTVFRKLVVYFWEICSYSQPLPPPRALVNDYFGKNINFCKNPVRE